MSPSAHGTGRGPGDHDSLTSRKEGTGKSSQFGEALFNNFSQRDQGLVRKTGNVLERVLVEFDRSFGWKGEVRFAYVFGTQVESVYPIARFSDTCFA